MAAAYLSHIVRNPPFADGSNGVGAAAADVFPALNGPHLQSGRQAYERLVRAVAEGRQGKAAAAEFLRRHT